MPLAQVENTVGWLGPGRLMQKEHIRKQVGDAGTGWDQPRKVFLVRLWNLTLQTREPLRFESDKYGHT